MNRDYWVGRDGLLGNREQVVRAAFHEAGHAAAICLRNKIHGLPGTHFRISLCGLKQLQFHDGQVMFADKMCYARLEGGLLLENPVLSEKGALSSQVVLDFGEAWEADVVNLMAGPLAEAKHVAHRDNEHFNRFLVDYDALKNYGGKSDQEKVDEYLAGLGLSPQQKAEKLKALHAIAFDFVEDICHWRAIARLANYILDREKDLITCDEAMAILDDTIETHFGFGDGLCFQR
ncbi:MAG: hypothetical protein PHH11_02660 [Methylomonas sp.]|nr:hypothetical protein [Methylomonas sp.]